MRRRHLKAKNTGLWGKATPEEIAIVNEKSKKHNGISNITYKMLYGDEDITPYLEKDKHNKSEKIYGL